MDVLVVLEDRPEHSTVLAHVNSVPASLDSERPSREVVTLFGDPTPETLALALAVAVEAQREPVGRSDVIRHVALWPERGAVGDAAWREPSGQLRSTDVGIPMAVLRDTAESLLAEGGSVIRRLVAGLRMTDWPEGSRRAITFSLSPALAPSASGSHDAMLDSYRQANGIDFDLDGD